MFRKKPKNDDDVYDMPPPPVAPLSPEEQAKQNKRLHRILVLVIFQTLVIIALFVAVTYKAIQISINLM